MPVTLKRTQMSYKDSHDRYVSVDVVAEKTTAELVADIEEVGEQYLNDIEASGTATIENVEQAVADSQTAVAGIDAQRDAMIAAIASVAGQGTDTSLTQIGVAADAAAVGSLKSAITFDEYLINSGEYTIKADDLESGVWNYSGKSANAARGRTKFLLPVRAGMIIKYISTTYDVYFGVLQTQNSGTYLQTSGWVNGTGEYAITNDGYMTFNIRNHSDTSATVDVSVFDGTVTIATNINTDLVEDATTSGVFAIYASRIEQGWWNWGNKGASFTRIRYNRLVKVSKGTVVNFTVGSTFDIYLGVAPAPGSREWSQYMYWTQGDGTEQKFLVNADGYLGIILRNHDGSDISPDDYTSTISIVSPAMFPTLNKLTCRIFRKVVCCGDSYTAGYIRTDEPAGTPSVMTHEDYAWPHYMETITGNKWENCGSSGATTISWQTVARGLPKAQSLGKSQAYVIGLMINDVGTTYHVDIGTSADIGTEANTYYAQLSKIIRELHTINSDAIIFVNTCPRNDSSFAPYNQAVRDIVNAYKETYHAHCIDLYNYLYLYDNASLTGDSLNGHFTAIGYEQFAEIYAYILSDYINSNISDFQSVHKIPYDE